MLEAILYAIPLGIMLSFSAGPVFFVVIETSISKSKIAALMVDLGGITADIIFIVIAFYSSQSVIGYIETNPWISIVSGLAVSSLGLYYIFKPKAEESVKPSVKLLRKRYFFLKGFGLNFINIGSFFFWLITTITISSTLNHNSTHLVTFFTFGLSTYLIIDLFKIHFANKLRNKLKGNTLLIIEKSIGIILICLGVFIVLRNYFL